MCAKLIRIDKKNRRGEFSNDIISSISYAKLNLIISWSTAVKNYRVQ